MIKVNEEAILANVPEGWEVDRIDYAKCGESFARNGHALCADYDYPTLQIIVKRKRWLAEYGKVYWHVNSRGMVSTIHEYGTAINDDHYEEGNYHQTREQAERFAKESKAHRLKLHEEGC
jgi:hypothetical protein